MISLEGVTSELVTRNESWVRKQAQQLSHRLPANVERADLIQAGLIAVAQASLTFAWDGDGHGSEAQEGFVRYARQRVRGAMLDELRQMDTLGRGDRRKVKVLEIARERWFSCNGAMPALQRLSELTGFDIDAISDLDTLAASHRASTRSPADNADHDEADRHHPVTERDEVEARVDTAIVMRHLERFFARLPDRDRRVIDSYLGVGLSPVELAASMQVTPSRVSTLYRALLQRLTAHFDYHHHRAVDRRIEEPATPLDHLIELRESEIRQQACHWTDELDDVLVKPAEAFVAHDDDFLAVGPNTRWG